MNTRDLIAHIETTAPLEGAAGWDKSGVQIAGTKDSVQKLAVSIDPTPKVIKEALDWGADFILTHHPLCMEAKFLDQPGRFLDVARSVLSHGSWLYAAHTSLDVQATGPAGWLAREFELTGVHPMEPTMPDDPTVGFGFIGNLPEALDWATFAERLAGVIDREFMVSTGNVNEPIRTVAYCTGSGGSLIDTAERCGADVYITGDIKYHQALDSNIFIVDVGHFSLEEKMSHIFAIQLEAELAGQGLEVQFFPGQDPFTLHAGI